MKFGIWSIAWVLVAAAPAARGAETAVLVLPFAAVNEPEKNAWIGRAIQQNLLTELSRIRTLHSMTPAGATTAMEVQQAQEAGREAGASLVVFGSFQLTEAGLRMTGQVLDAAAGKIIGGMKATGPFRDLFALEDSLSTQAERIITGHLGLSGESTPLVPVLPRAVQEIADLPPRPTSFAPPVDVDYDVFDRHSPYVNYVNYDDYSASLHRYRYSSFYPYAFYRPIYHSPPSCYRPPHHHHHHHRPRPSGPVDRGPRFRGGFSSFTVSGRSR